MDVATLILILLMGVLFPTFPLSLPASFLLQRFRKLRGLLFIALPIAGFILYAGAGKPLLPGWALALGLFSSALYALKSLSAGSLSRWTVYHYVSVFSLIWVFLSRAEINLVFVVGMVLPFTALNLVLNSLESVFGSTHRSVLRGVGSASPILGLFTALSMLTSIAMPTAPVFFKAVTASLLLSPYEFVALAVIWFLWGWSGVRLLAQVITGEPKENLLYEDVDRRTALLMAALSVASLTLGFAFLEVLL